MRDLDHVVISGGSRGLGAALAAAWLERGLRVTTLARSAESEDLARLDRLGGGHHRHLVCDLADQSSIAASAEEIAADVGRVDILVNNAGTTGNRGADEPRHKQLGELDGERLLHTFQINTVGPLLLTQALLPQLRNAQNPKVVMISSEAGSCARREKPGTYDYGASKAALNMVARNLAADLGPDGPWVTCIHPGFVSTDMTQHQGPTPPEEAAAAIVELVTQADAGLHGAFVDRHGSPIPW